MILAITREGLLCYEVQHGYLKVEDYIRFLKKVKQAVYGERIALFYDGLNIHLDQRVMTFLNNNKWIKLQNEAWCSRYNPIEQYIGLIKRHYYKQKIRIGCNPVVDEEGKNRNELHMKKMIHEAFEHYRDYSTRGTVDGCMYKLK